MKILTSGQMREIDRRTIEDIGIPGPVLMESAGTGVVEAIRRRFPELERETVVVVAGKGNNGGDGLVAARRLHALGLRPAVLLLAARSDLKGDAALNLGIAERIGLDIVEVPTPAAWRRQAALLARATILIDAVFGTGLVKPAEGLAATAIEGLNKARGFTVAIDLPSGLSPDSFEIIGPAVRADLTVALAAPKIAHIFPPAADLCGDLVVHDIGIPPAMFEDPSPALELLELEDIRPYFGKRPRDGHKGTFGHVLILAGSWGKTGAASLAARAAYRSGAGLVTVATPSRCLSAVARSMAELMTEPLAETAGGAVAAEALPRMLELLEGKDALLLGPGLGTHPSTAGLVRSLLPKVKIQTVIDADGLNILGGHLGILKRMSRPPILTPHPGEFGRLLGLSVPEVLGRRLDLGPRFASDTRSILVLKGYRTLVAGPAGRILVNPTGNPGMGTGGAGDVLGGMIAAFAAVPGDPVGAAAAAVYLHGLAGDIAAFERGERSLVAGDIIRFIPAAVRALEASSA